MPLSKAKNKARMRLQRAQEVLGVVQPACNLNSVQPEPQFRPNKYADNWQVKLSDNEGIVKTPYIMES